MGSRCVDINGVQEAYKNWYNEYSAALKKQGVTDSYAIDNHLKTLWYNKIVQKDSTGIMQYIVHPDRSPDTAIRFGRSAPKETRILAVKETGKDTYTVATTNGTYTFKDGSATSVPTEAGRVVEMPIMANIKQMSKYDALMNDEEAKIRGVYERQLELINEPSKIIKLVENLDSNDYVNISKEHKNRLMNVVNMLVNPMKNFIPEMSTYLNNKADQNGGVIVLEGDNAGIYINQANRAPVNQLTMSATEAYIHEIVHAATSYAIRQNGASVAGPIQRLKVLRTVVMKSLKPEHLIGDIVVDRNSALAEAEKKLEYMNNNLEEFLAIAVTNDKVFEQLKNIPVYREKKGTYKNIWEQILDTIGLLMDRVFRVARKETKNTKADELLLKLMMQLAENNNKAIEVEREGVIDRAFSAKDRLDEWGSGMLDKAEELAKKYGVAKIPQNLNKVQEAKWLAVNMWKFLANPETRPSFEWMLTSMGLQQEGSVQTFIRNLRDSDSLQLLVEQFGLLSSQIDKRRETTALEVASMALQGFEKRPSDKELNAVTLGAFDVDLSSIYDGYTETEMIGLMTHDDVLRNELSNVRKELRSLVSKAAGNYYVAQAEGLGRYMAIGVGDKALVYNAESIADMKSAGLAELGTTDATVVQLIDKLATLEGMKYLDSSVKEQVASLIDREPIGMKNMMAYHKSFVRQSKERLFNGAKAGLMIKGYSKEIFDATITMKIAPIKDLKSLEREGFTLEKILTKAEGDTSVESMAIYINKHHMTQSFNQHNMRITDLNRKGTSVMHARRYEEGSTRWKKGRLDVLRMTAESKDIVDKMIKGEYRYSEEGVVGPSPVYNEEGSIVDFRYMMPKSEKIRLLKQKLNAAHVLGRSMASIQDKVESSEFNKELMKVIRSDMDENYEEGTNVGRNSKEYVVIEADSSNSDIQDIYNILPQEVKKDIEENGKIAVRRDLLYGYFGFRDVSIADTFLFRLTPKQIREVVRAAEMWWKDIVKIHKVDIIIRVPQVLIGNIISNIMIPIMMGHRPDDVLKMQWQGFREIKQYQKNVHELVRLKEEQAAGNPKNLDLSRIKQLENDIELSPAKDLIDEGLFQAIIEDASMEDLRINNRLTEKKNEWLEKVGAPGWVKDGADILWLTDRTKFFKMMTTATQYSDFIARYAQYNLTIDKLKKQHVRKTGKQPTEADIDKMKKSSVILVRDAYINYDIPSSKWVQYANDIGLVMFTKYFERIQKVIRTSAKDKPASVLMALLAQTYITGDIDDITDQSMFTKNYNGMFHLDPFEHIAGVITPSLGEYVYEAYKMLK